MRASWSVVLGILASFSLSACAMSGTIGREAVEYNKVLGDAANEQLVLNIVRGSKRHPMHFTGVGSLTRGISTSASLTGGLPFGRHTQSPYALGGTFGASGGPTLALGVHDSEKFMRGITTPISIDTLHRFWAAGWPRQVLLTLLVRRIDDPESPDKVYVGYPGNAAKYKRFIDYVGELAEKIDLVADDNTKEFGPLLKEGDAITDGVLAAATSKGYGLKKVGDKFQIMKAGTKFSFVPVNKDLTPDTTPGATKRGVSDPNAASSGEFSPKDDDSAANAAKEFVLYLRSPQELLYHLGEIVRSQNDGGQVPMVKRPNGSQLPLFVAARKPCQTSCCDITVTYCGETYTVPGDPSASYSMAVLTLAGQLIGLQKSADDLPRAGIVTVVGN